jgi:hypothetical protein
MVNEGGPYLEKGESIILTTDRVSVNSVQYDMLLTTRNLILVQAGHTRFQPIMYPLLSILSVKGGKTANGELVISLFFDETGGEDNPGPMVLVFSQKPGEQRLRERDDWIKKLMKLIVSVRQEITIKGSSPTGQQGGIQPSLRRTFAPERSIPYKTVPDTHPAHVELIIIPDEPEPPGTPEYDEPEVIPLSRAEEEIPGVVDRVAESPGTPEYDEPEVIPLSRAEEEIPGVVDRVAESPGTPEYDEPEVIPLSRAEEEIPGVVDQVAESPGIKEYDEPEVIPLTRAEEEIPGVGDLVTESPCIQENGEPEVIPLTRAEEEIPGVDDQVAESPGTPENGEPNTAGITDTHEENTVSKIGPETLTREEITVFTQKDTGYPDPSLSPEQIVVDSPQDSPKKDSEPKETKTSLPGEGQESFLQPLAEATSPPETPPPSTGPGSRRRAFIAVTAIMIIILLIAGPVVYYSSYRAPPGVVEPAPIPTHALQLTPEITPVIIPTTGVWVRVEYPGNYYGWLGSPGALRGINSSGDQLYKMPESARFIQVNMYKQDYSGNTLTVQVYREGKIINNRTVSVPGGSIEIIIDTKTGIPPTLTPVVTQSENQTEPRGGRIMYF